MMLMMKRLTKVAQDWGWFFDELGDKNTESLPVGPVLGGYVLARMLAELKRYHCQIDMGVLGVTISRTSPWLGKPVKVAAGRYIEEVISQAWESLAKPYEKLDRRPLLGEDR
jgi:hypothetical protein